LVAQTCHGCVLSRLGAVNRSCYDFLYQNLLEGQEASLVVLASIKDA
jgi:hypothetical protein